MISHVHAFLAQLNAYAPSAARTRRVLDKAYQAYIDETNNDSNSNKTNANVVANNNTNNKNNIHLVGTSPPRSPSPAKSISSRLTEWIFSYTSPSSRPASHADSSVEFLAEVPPPRSFYYFYHLHSVSSLFSQFHISIESLLPNIFTIDFQTADSEHIRRCNNQISTRRLVADCYIQ